ncbi:MAG: hypothetical protein JWQ57_4994 [Mucilaginibacter sp.]|nr:hypothetical protein [Mucilaginibacter sp.]
MFLPIAGLSAFIKTIGAFGAVVAFYRKPGSNQLNNSASLYPVAKLIFASRTGHSSCFANSWDCVGAIIFGIELIFVKSNSHYLRGIVPHKIAQKQRNKTAI